MPRSNLYDASVPLPIARFVRWVLEGSKFADSRSTDVVPSVTPESTPPTTPARATGPDGSAMASMGGRRSWVSSSSVASRSPARACLTMIVPSATLS